MTTTEPPTPAAPAPLSDERLAAYSELIANATPLGAVTASPGILDTLLAEVHRQRAELSQYEMLSPQQCPAGKHADWLVDSEYAHACPWCEIERQRDRIAELEAYANGCDAEGCVIPHSSWCEDAKKTAAANNGCTCGQPWTGHPQPHAMHCWTVNPPRAEVEEMRRALAERPV